MKLMIELEVDENSNWMIDREVTDGLKEKLVNDLAWLGTNVYTYTEDEEES